MARQGIFTGSTLNDGTGDPLVLGAKKVNDNFLEIYNALGDGNTLLSGDPNLNVGFITSTGAEFTGNVTIGGTLTYEDVTNIDSVGIITARDGIEVTGGGILVGAAFSVSSNGDVTISGITTFESNITANGVLDVDGNTFLDVAVVSERLDSVGIITARSGIDIGDPDGAGIGVSFSSRGHGYVGLLTVYDEFQVGPNLVGNGVTITSTGVNVTGIVTATSFEGSGAALTNIPNSALDNSSVSFGGVSLSLGGSDATPAFDLTDATNYPYSSLTGISTQVVGDSTPQLGGDLDINTNNITGTGNLNITGILSATGGISTGVNSPISINLVGTDIVIEVAGVGIHTLALT